METKVPQELNQLILSHLISMEDFRTYVSLTDSFVPEYFFNINSTKSTLKFLQYETCFITGKEDEGILIDSEKEGWWSEFLDTDTSSFGVYIHGIREGYWQIGRGLYLCKVSYVNGNPNGEQICYYTNGNIYEHGFFDHGKQEGRWKKYDESERLISEGNYVNGKQEGLWEYYNENQKIKTGNFSEGYKDGEWTDIFYDGSFVQKIYQKGTLIKTNYGSF